MTPFACLGRSTDQIQKLLHHSHEIFKPVKDPMTKNWFPSGKLHFDLLAYDIHPNLKIRNTKNRLGSKISDFVGLG